MLSGLSRIVGWAVLAAVLVCGSSFLPSPSSAVAVVTPTLFAQPSAAPVRLVEPYRVTVGATAVQVTTSGNVHGIVLKALAPGQTIYIGASSAVTTSTGYPMSDGETLTLEVRNANQLYAIASAAAQSVAVLPFTRY